VSVVVAYAYRSQMGLAAQLATLRAATEWEWIERDSEYWGDYISAHAGEIMLKIFSEGDGYLFEFKCLTPEAEARWEEQVRLALRQLAPLVGAEEVRRAESNN